MMKRLVHWYYGKASIRKKLILSYLLLVSIPIIVLGSYAFYQSKKNLESQTIRTIDNNLSRMVSVLGTSLQRENDNTRYLAYNIIFRKALNGKSNSKIAIAKALNEQVEPTFWYFITSDSNIKEINIYTPYVAKEIGNFVKPASIYRMEDWYLYHQKNFKTLWTYENGELFVTRSILDERTSTKTIGVLRMEVFLNSILEPINSLDFLDNGIIILDHKDQVIYQKETKNKKINKKVMEQILQKNQLTEEKNRQFILKSETVEESNWRIYYYINQENISGLIYVIMESTLCIAFICFLVVILLISIVSKLLSQRILSLKECSEKVARGDFESPVYTKYTDEIGVVTNSFGNMTKKLNEMINRVYKMEIEKKATELKALQAMINPHFLYNCLSGIKWKAIKSGDEDISEITGLLAKFYRTSLNNGNQITKVSSELENIQAYLEIQRKTKEKQFKVEYKIDESLFEYDMLNFMLQPIVENAIKHGIDYQEEEAAEGLILIEFTSDDKFLIFKIYNSGSTIEPEKLQIELNKPGKGYGIYNIRQRIELYYGKECGLYPSVTAEKYTCFTLKILKEVNIVF